MNKTLALSLAAVALSVNALPTYEPFTEFAPQVAANPTNAIDLATGGYSAPSGELWTGLDFSALATGAGQTAGLDVLVTTNKTLYTANSVIFPGNIVSSLLPPGFPGAPTNLIQNPTFMANAGVFNDWPGYIGGNGGTITDWTTSTGDEGVNGPGINGDTGLFSNGSGSPFGPANQANGPYTYLFIQGTPTGYASQSLPSLAPNTTYVLSFQASARSSEATNSFQVQIGDDNGMGDIFSSGTNAANATAFVGYSYTFTTPASFSGTPSIELENVTETNAGYTSGKTVNFADVSLAPSTAPTSIPIFVVNPAQPGAGATTVGNSAVLNFAHDITRPSSGTKTFYVSYMFRVAQQGQLGGGNDGRYLGFLAASNLVEPSTAYPYWNKLFNTYGTGADPKYCGHGLLGDVGNVSAWMGACDSSAGKDFSGGSGGTPFFVDFGVPSFVVGSYTFTSGQGVKDTNSIWVNPPPGAFGGATPPVSPTYNDVMAFSMSDLGGLVLIDRVGSGASGGVGTNYIANLLVGSTWSYVTGGPEFTTQPTNSVVLDYGTNVFLNGAATAAGQNVTYQWQKVTASTTNNLTDTAGGAGGSATVSGSATANLGLVGVSAGDMGTYQLVATAAGTGYTLTSSQVTVTYVGDPDITSQPAPQTVNYGATVSFSASAITATGAFTYGWYDGTTPLVNGVQPDGSTISGASGSVSGNSLATTLTLSGVSYKDDGNYLLYVTNGENVVVASASAALAVNDPYIVTQPQSAIVANPGIATNLVVSANGSPTLSYQWYSTTTGQLANGGDISGVTTSNLTFSSLQLSDAGTYYAIVTGPGGTVQSSSAVITVLPIVTQPPSIVVVPTGATTNITVGTVGSGLTYQWYSSLTGQLYNSGDFAGVTTSTLTITNAAFTDSANYYLVVNWLGGSETSSNVSVFIEATTNGPFSPSNLPPTVANSTEVDYGIFDANYQSDTPDFVAPSGWNQNLTLPASAGDQTYTTGNVYNGLAGDLFTSSEFNIVDPNWQRFASYPVIDVLLQVYGNTATVNATNGQLVTAWTEGQLWQGPYYAHAGFPLGAVNGQWNWMLIEVTNPVDSTVDSSPYVIPGAHVEGDVGSPPQTSSGGEYGGVNNGSFRMDVNAAGLTIRMVALGPQGVFGTSNEINRFALPANCAPEPTNNLAWIDFNKGTANHLTVNNNASAQETYQVVSGVGPANDQRTAIQATSSYMEFPIQSNYLGQPCNGDFTMQLCMEVYDDPNLAGEQFGPIAFATDSYGDIGYVPGYPNTYNQSFFTLTGSGQWVKVDWFVGPANLEGLNTAPLTGGPAVYWGLAGTPPYVDRIELGVVQTGTNPLAGQIPDPSYNIDPFICSATNNAVGYYAEWDPTDGVTNNLTTASGYGTALWGPSGDQRIAETPNSAGGTSGVYYEQFALQSNVFGPVLQDNADVAQIVTYYDDPALAGSSFFVNTYTTMQDGSLGTVSPSGPTNLYYVTLQGTGKWVDAHFEIPNENFAGTPSFGVAPNFVCRYASSAPVYISRVRYNVIRPCGQYEGIDYLQGTVAIGQTNAGVQLDWRGTATLQGTSNLAEAYANIVAITNDVTNTFPLPATNNAEFFRLQFPSYPTNLSPYAPSP